MTLPLRDYQVEAIDVVSKNILKGEKRQLVSLPTGTGKTVVFSSFIDNCFSNLGMQRALVLAHRDELISQAVAKVKRQLPDAEVGIVKASNNETEAQIVVASIQTLSRKKRLEQFDQDTFDIIVVDEAHHAYSPAYMKILAYFGGFSTNRATKVVGFTATAQRPGLDRIFNLVYHKDIREMIQKGYLVPVNCIQIKTRLGLYGLGLRGGDFSTDELNQKVNTPERNKLVVDGYMKHAFGEIAIAFTVSVEHAIDLCQMFQMHGIEARYIHAGTSPAERQEILKGQQAGRIKIICNCGILTEGYDDPQISTVLMARPTLSSTLYIQMVGRGLRLHDDKDECKVIDFVDNVDRHDLITLPFLLPDFKGVGGSKTKRTMNWGTLTLDGEEETEEDIADAEDEQLEIPDNAMDAIESDVDLFNVRANLNWEEFENQLITKANRRVRVRVVEENGWYNIMVDHKRKQNWHSTTLNKKPFLTQDDAKFMAEVYIIKMGFTLSEKRKREHRDNPNCQELLRYADSVDFREVLTAKEAELLAVFLDSSQGDVQINRTAKCLGCTHTNVWIRLYGPKVGEIGGILKKMRDAYEAQVFGA